MKYGFSIPNRGPNASPENLATLVGKAEEWGYHCGSTGDHIVVPANIGSRYPYTEGGEFPGSSSGESMEQITLLAYLAGITQKLQLVTGVIIVPHRNPLLAAKALATLDVLSHGRLVVGIGAGWMKEEFQALDLPPFEERGAVTDEYIRAFKELWSSDNPTFEGKYCRFSDISFLPKPVQKPHPPIWVGGESPRAIRRTAELADGWYPIGSNPDFPMGTPDQLAAGIKRLASRATRAGRDPSEIEVIYRSPEFEIRKSTSGERHPFTGTAGEIAADIRQYEELGVDYLLVDFFRITSSFEEALQRMEELTTQVWPRV